jgi:hypothetical protein
VESKLGPLGTSATEWPIVPAPDNYDDGEFGGMKIDRGNRSTRRKLTPAPLWRPQILLDQTRARTRAAAVGSQQLTASAMARPCSPIGSLRIWSRSVGLSPWIGLRILFCCVSNLLLSFQIQTAGQAFVHLTNTMFILRCFRVSIFNIQENLVHGSVMLGMILVTCSTDTGGTR